MATPNVSLREIAFSSPLSILLTGLSWSILIMAMYFGPDFLRTYIPATWGWASVVIVFLIILIASWLFFGFQIKSLPGHRGLGTLLMSTHFQCDSSLPPYLISDQTSLYCAYVEGISNGVVLCIFVWLCLLLFEYYRVTNYVNPNWWNWFRQKTVGESVFEKQIEESLLEKIREDTRKYSMWAFPVVMIFSVLLSVSRTEIRRTRHNYLLTELQRLGLSREDAIKTLIDKEDFTK